VPALRAGRVIAGPGRDDGIISVPGGLVHHWTGAAFIPGVSVQQVLNVSYAYADYPTIYKPVLASKLVSREGDAFHVWLRIKEGVAGVSAVLDIWSKVQYLHPDARRAISLSEAESIREVRNAGRPDERHLPAGEDSGYLWRAHTFTEVTADDDGVYLNMQTLGLSRRFPRLLAWMIEPIARRLGRKSVEASLEEFRRAVLARSRAR
jgi:hypothetical protein